MADSSQYDEATLARRYAMAQELMKNSRKPVTHWAEGLANLAESALGGYQTAKLDAERRAEKAAERAENYKMFGLPAPASSDDIAGTSGAAMLARTFGLDWPGSKAASAPAAATASPAPTSTPPTDAPDYGKAIAGIESGGAYDKLGPVTKTGDRAFGKYQVMGANIPQWTKAHVGQEMTPEQFLRSPEAQEAVFKSQFGQLVQKYGPEGAARAWFAGEGGMNNPNAKDQLGTTVQGYGQKFMAGLGPQAATNAPAASPPANPFAHLPQETRERMAAGMSSRNPNVRAMTQALMQQHLKPPEYGFKTAGDTLYRTNPRTGAVEPIKDVGRGVQPMTAEQRKQWNVPEGMSAGVDDNGKPVFSPAGTNINLNTAQAGTKAMQAKAVEDFQAAQEGSRSAVKRSAIWDQMEQAAKGFTPGATADLKLTAKRYLKDTGFIAGEDVPDAEVFKQLQQQIAIHAQPKGQGAVSNVERELFAKAIPNITMSPEGLSRSIQISRSLDEYDRKVAQVYRDNARKHQGIPDSVEVNEEIEKLGSPISTSDSNYLQKAASGAATASTVRKFNPATGKIE